MTARRPPRAGVSLSIAERRVGSLVAASCSDALIAERLLLSMQAVEWTVAKLSRRFGAGSREELAALLDERPIWVTESEPA